MKKVLVILLAVLAVFTGCAPETAEGEGRLVLRVNEPVSRGIESVDTVTASYLVEIDPLASGLENMKYELSDGENVLDIQLPSGEYSIQVWARNSAGQPIGCSEWVKANIFPFRTNEISVNVTLVTGTADINVTVETTASPLTLTAGIWNREDDTASSPAVTTIELVKGDDGNYRGTFSKIQGGYWQVVLMNEGKAITAPEIVRLIGGYNAEMKVAIKDSWDVDVTINNSIVPSPSLSIEGVLASYLPGDAYSFTAKVSGMTPAKYTWYLDGSVLKVTDTAELTGTLPADGAISYGEHTLALVAYGDLSWSDSVTFEVADPSLKKTECSVGAGDLELNVIGDVFVPEALVVDVLLDGQEIEQLAMPHFNRTVHVEKGGIVSVRLSGAEGYSCYLEPSAEEGRTVIMVVIDRAIPNPAYVHFTFTQKFHLGDNRSRGMFFNADVTRFPSTETQFEAAGHIGFCDRVSERTIKVDPDTYTFWSHSGSNCPNAYWADVKTETFTVAAGETVDVEISSQPYATVTATLPGIEDGRTIEVRDADGHSHAWNLTSKDGQVVFDYSIYPEVVLRAVATDGGAFAYYETEPVAITEGPNAIEFHKVEPAAVATGVTVAAGDKVTLNYDMRAIMPEAAEMYVGVTGYEDACLFRQSNVFRASEDGELAIKVIGLEGYEVTASEGASDASGKIINVVIDLPSEKRVPVTLNYKFEYSEEINGNTYPMLRGDVRNEAYLISLLNGRTTVNMPAGHYYGGGSLKSWANNHDVWVRVEEKDITVSAEAPLTLNLYSYTEN